MPTTEQTYYVYFVTDGDYIKIGVASDIYKRIKGIQTGNPKKVSLVEYLEFQCKEYALFAEKELHRMFAERRTHGEWFDIANDYDFLMFIRRIDHDYNSIKTEFGNFMDAHWTTQHKLTYAVYGR